MTAEFHDDFTGAAGALSGRVSPTGHTWGDANGDASGNPTLELDGSGLLVMTANSNPPGAYGDIHLASNVTRMEATIGWTGSSADVSQNSACVLICSETSNRSGAYPPGIGIYTDAIHPIFGPWQMNLTKYNAGVASSPILTYNYPGGGLKTDGTPYKIGVTYDGERLLIDCPDGSRVFAVDPDFKTMAGPHLIYQIYNTPSPGCVPFYYEVAAYTSPRLLGRVGNALGMGER